MKSRLLIIVLFCLFFSLKSEETLIRLEPVFAGQVDKESANRQSDQLCLSGVPYGNYSRILLKFDLSGVSAEKYGELKRATLKLKAEKVSNPGKVPTYIGAFLRKWPADGNALKYWSSELWPRHSYDRKKYDYVPSTGVIEYAYRILPGNGTVIERPGTVSFDLTRHLNSLLYLGKEDFGLALRNGSIFVGGRENRGRWNIEFSSGAGPGSPVLELAFAGKPPQRISTIREYPSALLPPVKNPYLFLFYNWNAEANALLWKKYFRILNTDGVFEEPEFLQHGILGLKCLTGPQAKWLSTTEGFLNYYRSGRLGIAVDEWQSVDDTKKRAGIMDPNHKMGKNILSAIEALKILKKESPSRFLTVYWRGEDSLRPLAEEGLPDLVIAEGYTRLPRFPHWEIGSAPGIRHPEWAKEDGYYERTIILHGTLEPPKMHPEYKRHFTPEAIAEEVRYLREKYPEMPGSGIYCEYINPRKDQTLEEAVQATLPVLKAYEEALEKYFIRPAPDVVITEPFHSEHLTSLKVRIGCKANPKDGRTIRKYKWFIDNRLVKETAEPEWLWDIRPEKAGMHIITVHAIDSGFNRSAAQIPVFIK